MPRPGGDADKIGNQYESVWTTDVVIDVFLGRFLSITVEAIGDESEGVEFHRPRPLRPRRSDDQYMRAYRRFLQDSLAASDGWPSVGEYLNKSADLKRAMAFSCRRQ